VIAALSPDRRVAVVDGVAYALEARRDDDGTRVVVQRAGSHVGRVWRDGTMGVDGGRRFDTLALRAIRAALWPAVAP
jgi:hypothetical protein